MSKTYFSNLFDQFNKTSKNHDEMMKQMQSRPTANVSKYTKNSTNDNTSESSYENVDYVENRKQPNISNTNSFYRPEENALEHIHSNNEIVQLHNENNLLSDEHEQLKREYDILYSDYEAIYDKHEKMKSFIEKQTNNIIQLQNKITRMENRLNLCKKTIAEQERIVKEYESELFETEKKHKSIIDSFNNKMDQIKTQNQKLQIENKHKSEHVELLQTKVETLIKNKQVLEQMNHELLNKSNSINLELNKSTTTENEKPSNDRLPIKLSDYIEHIETIRDKIKPIMQKNINEWMNDFPKEESIRNMDPNNQMVFLVNKLRGIKTKIKDMDECVKNKVESELIQIKDSYQGISDSMDELRQYILKCQETVYDDTWINVIEPKLKLKLSSLKTYLNQMIEKIDDEDWNTKQKKEEKNEETPQEIKESIKIEE